MSISNFISFLLASCKNAAPIRNNSDYYREKSWKNKASFLYLVFTVIAILITVVLLGNDSKYLSDMDLPKPLTYMVIPLVALLAAWGFATMLLNFKLFIKSLWSSGVEGYKTGEQIQTQHTYITHDYGDRYRVTTETENQGCAVAFVNGFINLFIWSFLCVYICPFLTFGKISKTKKNLRNYKRQSR